MCGWERTGDTLRCGSSYKTVFKARVGIGRYLTFYNRRRPHSCLDRHTPDQA
jgi:putative transposase